MEVAHFAEDGGEGFADFAFDDDFGRGEEFAAVEPLDFGQAGVDAHVDIAHFGRHHTNATMFASHGVDTMTGASYAMDLAPLLDNPTLEIRDFIGQIIDDFKNEVLGNLPK